MAKEYLSALARGDAQAVAACWTADGEFIDAEGNAHPAKDLAGETQPPVDGDGHPEIKVTSSKIRFVTPDVAIEDGSSEVVWPDVQHDPPVGGHFHATWVKQQGRWRLASLCEFADAVPVASLAELEWLVGTWTATSADATLESTVRWNDAGTFLLRETTVAKDGRVAMRGLQQIGLDPVTGELKSWGLDSHGGHTEAVWTRSGDAWVEQGHGALPDGRTALATAVITFDGQDRYVQKLLAARIDGEPVADQEITFTRLGDAQP